MNNELKPIIEQAEKAKTVKEKVDCVITFLKVLSNHIPSMDKRIKKLERSLYIIAVVILLALLGTNQIALGFIVKLINLF